MSEPFNCRMDVVDFRFGGSFRIVFRWTSVEITGQQCFLGDYSHCVCHSIWRLPFHPTALLSSLHGNYAFFQFWNSLRFNLSESQCHR